MAAAVGSAEACALVRPASRRFYVHVGSLGFLVAAQPTFFDELAYALALSGASRALDQLVEDWTLFCPDEAEPVLDKCAGIFHELGAVALQNAFQCIVQLVPPRFGATELLLGSHEQISAWCYEDGYLTYATDQAAAAIMYAEAGSLRQLRSEIRRSPDFDPALEMITGQSLFLFDQRGETGPGTALFYKRNAMRRLRAFSRADLPAGSDGSRIVRELEKYIAPSTRTMDGGSVIDECLRRSDLMVTTLLRSMPPSIAGVYSTSSIERSDVDAP